MCILPMQRKAKSAVYAPTLRTRCQRTFRSSSSRKKRAIWRRCPSAFDAQATSVVGPLALLAWLLLMSGSVVKGSVTWRYVFTKLDSQVHLPPNYFEELERACQQKGSGAVVWQPLPVAGLSVVEDTCGEEAFWSVVLQLLVPSLVAMNEIILRCIFIRVFPGPPMSGLGKPGGARAQPRACACYRRCPNVFLPDPLRSEPHGRYLLQLLLLPKTFVLGRFPVTSLSMEAVGLSTEPMKVKLLSCCEVCPCRST